ncbi:MULTISPECIES: SDR family oxidoreductase [Rhizobium/Agrobacterium group]|uniref:SDR family oxidoreductase n=1 Tax=Rhizobium/Agrobacterium group TaxID=227290 RepID=UPI000FDB19A0|nr:MULTISPECIES: SDR family oxidoreductase [Rhizobium/Agrobacterium group]RVT69637.1 SDR family oxidoreductase [Agrobacterium sp. CNPSo 2736]WHO77294.1 SDR family oxidoreductase [Rhizobium sp. BT03]
MVSLSNQRAIVTAGASGIGRVVARTLHSTGANVAVCDISEAALESFSRENPKIAAYQCDVRDAEAVASVTEEMITTLQGVDILVNNAGIAGPTKNVEDISPTQWDETVVVNLNAQFYFCRNVIPHLKRQKSGSIINLSSAAGRLGFPYRTPYAAAKWGVIGFTESLAMELGEFNIRVNSILPGSVNGDRMNRVIAERAKLLGISEEAAWADELKNISMHKMIDPEEIADLIAFVCSPSGRSISGQSLGICGNMEVIR